MSGLIEGALQRVLEGNLEPLGGAAPSDLHEDGQGAQTPWLSVSCAVASAGISSQQPGAILEWVRHYGGSIIEMRKLRLREAEKNWTELQGEKCQIQPAVGLPHALESDARFPPGSVLHQAPHPPGSSNHPASCFTEEETESQR